MGRALPLLAVPARARRGVRDLGRDGGHARRDRRSAFATALVRVHARRRARLLLAMRQHAVLPLRPTGPANCTSRTRTSMAPPTAHRRRMPTGTRMSTGRRSIRRTDSSGCPIPVGVTRHARARRTRDRNARLLGCRGPSADTASGKPARHRPAPARRRHADPHRHRLVAAGAPLRGAAAAGVPGAGRDARRRWPGRHPLRRYPLHLPGRLAVAGDHPVRRRPAHACGAGARQRRPRRAAGDGRRAGDRRADRGRRVETARPAAAGSLPARHDHRVDRCRRGVLPAARRRPAPGAARPARRWRSSRAATIRSRCS